MSALSVPHGQETPSRLVPPSHLEQGPPAQTTTWRAVRWSYRAIKSFFERIALHHLEKCCFSTPRGAFHGLTR